MAEKKKTGVARKNAVIFCEQLEALLSKGPILFWMISPADKSISFIKGDTLGLLGYGTEEIIGKPDFWRGRIHEEDRVRPDSLPGSKTDGTSFAEYRFRRKDGSFIWLHAVCRAIEGGEGEPSPLACCAFDIGKWKMTEAELHKNEKQFRMIAENLTDMVALVDLEGRRLYCTPNYGILGNPDLLKGTNSFQDIHPDDRERIKNIFLDTVKTGEGRRTEYRFLLKDGSTRDIESQGMVIKDAAGKPEKIIMISRDITDRRKTQVRQKELELQLFQADKLNALGKTLAGVAHELNNPLTGIMGYCQLLLREDDIQANTRRREDLEIIFREAERCQKIVKNLSTFARRHKPEKTFVGVNGIIENTLKLEEYQLRTRNINLTCELAPELPKTMADYHQLQQVFLNLAVNAQYAMTELRGKGALRVRTMINGCFIRVEFEDDGPGIAPENLDKIFEPFFTTKEAGKGTGLGLSIAYGIVSEHGGRIRAENNPAGGAKFIIELPVIEEAFKPGAPVPAICSGTAWSGQRVLIIDDEQCILDVLVRMLRLLNLSPDIAREGKSAMEKLKRNDYAVVLCDYHLPGTDGLELFNWLKKLKPELAGKLVFVTGSAGTATLEETGRPVLNKPFKFETFQKMLEKVIV